MGKQKTKSMKIIDAVMCKNCFIIVIKLNRSKKQSDVFMVLLWRNK
ncbi:hypothetical protein HMPREF1870_02117 [Bacteroidales bacterium KA00344]|nr:hypothetical protein HMPREF1870_02117 [Bacteroidales bacterium KA00344]